MSENAIYEISQMMQDKTNLQNDMNEVFSTVSDLFQRKYLNKIHKAVQTQQLQSKNNPPREAQLISVMKSFAHEDAYPAYDKMIDMLLTLDTFKKMSSDIQPVSIQENTGTYDASIHPDGIYDIDNACIVSKSKSTASFAGMLMMMSLLSGTKD